MTVRSPDRLYELLPAVYREQDADERLALRALLRIVTSQVDVVERDVAGLWNDLFIETCRRWVIPYIGDLVSNNLLYDAGRIRDEDTAAAIFTDLVGPDLRPPIEIRTRADVAKTIYYRRRKGTLPMLEELARDVTGWAVHAVEFFELLGWTQHLEHFRPQAAWFDIRSLERDERVDGPFDEASHSVDVRPISQYDGWHSIKNVGFFLWRLESNRLLNVPARVAGAPWQFHFSPLGNSMPLFSRWRREGDETGLSTELHVPGPIRRAFFARDLDEHRTTPAPDFTDLYGMVSGPPLTLEENADASLFVICDGQPIPPAQVVCRRLDPWPAARPSGAVIEIDVTAGRVAVGDGFAASPALDVTCHYGFPASLGGGTYSRKQWLRRTDPGKPLLRLSVEEGVAVPPDQFASLTAAIAHWSSGAVGKPDAVIVIRDSRTYALPTQIALADESELTIEAADGERPVLQTVAGGLSVTAPGADPDPERRGTLTLSGVVVEGFVHVEGDLGRLRLIHSTLVPGRRIAEGAPTPAKPWSIVIEGTSGGTINAHLRLQLAFSITGPIVCPEHADRIVVLDSIVDGLDGAAIASDGGGTSAPLTIERSTVLGTTSVHELEASESIFTDTVLVDRRQSGCVRFSYVPPKSLTPRRYRCQPDLGTRRALDEALAADPTLTQAEQDAIRDYVAGWLQPAFSATAYGQPAYCQLRLAAPVEIRTGAADGSEMGAYCHLKQPQRESNLRIRLDEYLPFGLEAGVIYVT